MIHRVPSTVALEDPCAALALQIDIHLLDTERVAPEFALADPNVRMLIRDRPANVHRSVDDGPHAVTMRAEDGLAMFDWPQILSALKDVRSSRRSSTVPRSG
jgi:hypothetical protein